MREIDFFVNIAFSPSLGGLVIGVGSIVILSQEIFQVLPGAHVALLAVGHVPYVSAPFGLAIAQVFTPHPDDEKMGLKFTKDRWLVRFHPVILANPAFQNRSNAASPTVTAPEETVVQDFLKVQNSEIFTAKK
jgi:hypothetical protein